MENKILSWAEFKDSGFDDSPYKFMEDEGTFEATFDLKRWGKKQNSAMAYFTLSDGRKIIAYTWSSTDYLGIKNIAPGTRITVTYKRNNNNFNCLTEIKVY